MCSYVKYLSQKIKGNFVSREMTALKSKQMSISCFLGMNYVLFQHEEIVIHMLLHLKNFFSLQTFTDKPVLDFEDIFETFSSNCFSCS